MAKAKTKKSTVVARPKMARPKFRIVWAKMAYSNPADPSAPKFEIMWEASEDGKFIEDSPTSIELRANIEELDAKPTPELAIVIIAKRANEAMAKQRARRVEMEERVLQSNRYVGTFYLD